MHLKLLTLLFVTTLYGQPGFVWQKTLGGTENDVTSNVRVTSDHACVFGGTSNSGISGNKTVISKGLNDFWVVKLHENGNIIWQKGIGGSADDSLNDMVILPDNSVLVGGISYSGISGDKTDANRGVGDFWIVKVNEDGEIAWQKTIGGNNIDILRSICKTEDGGFILGGTSASDISGEKTENARGNHSLDFWILKIDEAGNIEWQKTYGGSSSDDLYQIKQLADGGYIVVGDSSSPADFDKTESSFGGSDYWVMKLNNIGEMIWQKVLGGSDMDFARSLVEIEDGVLVGGFSASNISGNKTENSRGSFDFWIVKLGFDGNLTWQKTIGGSGADFLYSMTKIVDNKILLVGSSDSSISGEKLDPSRGMADIWVFQIDMEGNLGTQKTIGGNLTDSASSVVHDLNGAMILAGNSRSSISGEKIDNSWGETDFWAIKLSQDALSLNEFDTGHTVVYPNPTNGIINVQYGSKTIRFAELYDVFGRKQYFVSKPEKEFLIEIYGNMGVYFLVLTDEDNEQKIYKILKTAN